MADLLAYPGFIAGVCLVALALWLFGVQDEFILVGAALLVGGPLGWFAERAVGRALERGRERKP